MNQKLSPSIDLYLQTQKTNPFVLHLNSNASSQNLINLRNHAYILNKLTLLNLQHPSENEEMTFLEEVLELYAANIDAIIGNPLMPYRDEESVRDLVARVQHYYYLLSKLTYVETGQEGDTLRKKVSINSFWPRIRAFLIAIEQKIPQSHSEIREYVIIKRGMLETDKKYFLSQMMAKKIQTKALKNLIKKYEDQLQHNNETIHNNSGNKINDQMDEPVRYKTWQQVKKCVRMIPLTNQLEDWTQLHQFLISESFAELAKNEKRDIIEYIRDVIDDSLFNKRQISLGQKEEDRKKSQELMSQYEWLAKQVKNLITIESL